VTIAAGFKFKNGVALCADTEFSYGALLKVPGSKLISLEFPGQAALGFALCGSVDHASMAVEDIQTAVARTDFTYPQIKGAIRTVLCDTFPTHVFSHPFYGREGSPAFDLLIGVWTKADGLSLLQTVETAVHEVPDNVCVAGAGLYLAKYLLSPVLSQAMSRSDVEFWAVYVLQQAKKYVPGCGGESNFLFLDGSGKITKQTKRKLPLREEDVSNLYTMLPSVLTLAANLEASDEIVGDTMNLFKESVFAAREERRRRIESIRRVEEYIARKEKEQQG
jgi:hypothetical protein